MFYDISIPTMRSCLVKKTNRAARLGGMVNILGCVFTQLGVTTVAVQVLIYCTDQHRTGTDNYRYSNGQRFRVYRLYWVISGYIYRTGKL